MSITLRAHAIERCAERGIRGLDVIACVEKSLGPTERWDRWPRVTMIIRSPDFVAVYDHKREQVITVMLRSEHRPPGTDRLKHRAAREKGGKTTRPRRSKQSRKVDRSRRTR